MTAPSAFHMVSIRPFVVLSIHWRPSNWDHPWHGMEWRSVTEKELEKQLFAAKIWDSTLHPTTDNDCPLHRWLHPDLDVRHESPNRQMSPDLASMATIVTKWRLSRSSASHRWPDCDLSSGRKARALDSITTVVIDSQTMDDIWYSLSSRTSSPMTRLGPVLCPTGYAPVVDTTAVTESTTLSPKLKVLMLLVSKQLFDLFFTPFTCLLIRPKRGLLWSLFQLFFSDNFDINLIAHSTQIRRSRPWILITCLTRTTD